MWRAAAGREVKAKVAADDDDWDTDPNFVVGYVAIQNNSEYAAYF